MKANFGARPVYHQSREHIIVHFLICYAALMIYRLLEVDLERHCYHFTANQIIDTINNLNVDVVDDLVAKSLYTNSLILKAIEDIYKLDISNRFYLNSDLDKKLKNY